MTAHHQKHHHLIKRHRIIQPNIELRPWSKFDDVQAIAQRLVELLGQDETISRWTLLIPFPYTLQHGLEFLNFTKKIDEDEIGADLFLSIIDNNTNTIVGSCGAHQSKEHNRAHCFSIGYWIGKEYRRKGYAQTAVMELLKLLPESCLRVEATTFVENLASRGVLESCRFQCESELLRGYYVKNGVCYDGKLFAMVREQGEK